MKQGKDIKAMVSDAYGRRALQGTSCCGGASCPDQGPTAARLGYAAGDLSVLPRGSDSGLGCGNPVARADLRPGESVLDLGSGPGLDAILAARLVGAEGAVTGLDMTPDMLALAEANLTAAELANVRFVRGELERMPLPDASFDVVISNCVVNLSPDKAAAYREMFRVLKPGGRLCLADVLLDKPLPKALKDDEAWCA